MPRKSKSNTPPIKLHKSTGQAYVNLNCRRVYLGAKYGTPEANERHNRIVTEWKAGGCKPLVEKNGVTVVELIDRFLDHAEPYYATDNGTTSEAENFKLAFRPLKKVYATLPVTDFSPMKLKTVREEMIRLGWKRRYVNTQVNRIRAMVKWGVSEELVESKILVELKTVDPLKAGKTEAPESAKILPVDPEHVEAIKPFVSRQVWALIQVQRWTGARGGELFGIRAVDLDMTGDVWTFSPERHKTAHCGHTRRLYLNAKSQDVIRPFLADRPVDAPLFDPREAVDEHRQKRHEQRTTAMSCGNTPGSRKPKTRPAWAPSEMYTSDSYRVAIRRACKKAGVPHWHPHQLRHLRLTEIRKDHGIEAARVVAGHKTVQVTAEYAERDEGVAIEVARQTG